jgi:rRNA maturation endonuclease Nob1
MAKHTCLCLKCGRYFDLAIPHGKSVEDENCPLCGGGNIVQHNPMDFLKQAFGGYGGG